MPAAAGIVAIQAHTIRPATPQRTAEKRCTAPTPVIAPVIVCVVLTGIPKCEETNSVIAPAVSAQNPPNGVSFVIRWPIVFTIRHPPAIVPSPMAAPAATMTQGGMRSASVRWNNVIGKFTNSAWLVTNSATMMPIVFCASFVPCPREYSAADTSCSTRNDLSTRRGKDRRKAHDNATVSSSANKNPMTGATTMKTRVLVQPLAMIAEKPDLATAAPAYPPMSACEDEVGSPSHRGARRQHARRHDGGNRVGRVVEPIDEIEDESDEQNRQNEPNGACHQACLIVMDSTTFATSSAWSSVPSRLP